MLYIGIAIILYSVYWNSKPVFDRPMFFMEYGWLVTILGTIFLIFGLVF